MDKCVPCNHIPTTELAIVFPCKNGICTMCVKPCIDKKINRITCICGNKHNLGKKLSTITETMVNKKPINNNFTNLLTTNKLNSTNESFTNNLSNICHGPLPLIDASQLFSKIDVSQLLEQNETSPEPSVNGNDESTDELNIAINTSTERYVQRRRGILGSISERDHFQTAVLNFIKRFESKFRIGVLNINSLYHKLDGISFLLNHQVVDLLIINESKIDVNTDDKSIEFANYLTHRLDRTNKGGGIAVYVKKTLKLKTTVIYNEVEIISMVFELSSNYRLAIIACYRPPYKANESLYIEKFESIFLSLIPMVNEVIFAGDLNFNLLDPREKIQDFILAYDLTVAHTHGTRLNKLSGEYPCLDVVMSSKKDVFVDTLIEPCPFSDHDLVLTVLEHKTSPKHSNTFLSRCLNKERLLEIA